ncbi:Clavaminate synthase-like protein [Cristinia sonorae]|uniref:Clavaminate synthase-like protein n=1 Tax=Cristinia sonorae TaxID=1940300 RepID=A0A8K0UTC8_9AGAR|nr:Clavaminate synthase-like protein [Cristinia sonorae]
MVEWVQPLLAALHAQLEDDSDILTVGLQSCGASILFTLRAAVHDLIKNHLREEACKTLDDLADRAYLELRTSKNPSTCWRRLYTDSKILRTLAELVHPEDENATPTACIARLDHSIITAGACGEGRLELVLGLIGKIQSSYLREVTGLHAPLLPMQARSNFLSPHYSCTVPRLADPPSFTSFISAHSHAPFVISKYASEWPATQSWSDLRYLRTVAGPGRVVPVEVGGDYRSADWTQQIMGWDEFLDAISKPDAEKPLYLAQHDLFKQFPTLRDDVVLPDYVYAALPATKEFPEYRPPGNEDQLVMNVWLGPKGTVSPAHTDPYYNFYAQVVGRKTVWLAPPSATPFMYPYPHAQTSHNDQPHNPAANTIEPSMSNTSRVDVFGTPGEDEFTEFWRDAVALSMCVTLEPGDVLFFPPGWWHAMRSEEMSFSVSMWF